MFGSVVLEVLLGLVLVYLLLSLVSSTIQESLASLRNWRGTMLRDAIARLFDEPLPSDVPGAPHAKLFAAIGNSFARAWRWISGRPPSAGVDRRGAWTRAIYEHPLIDALHKETRRPPSYIPNATFADALVDLLVRAPQTSTPISPSDRLVGVLHALHDRRVAIHGLNDETAKALNAALACARERADTKADEKNRTVDALAAVLKEELGKQDAFVREPSSNVKLAAAVENARTRAKIEAGAPVDRALGILREALEEELRKESEFTHERLRDSTATALSMAMERGRQRVDPTAPDVAKRMLDAFKEEISAWFENTMNRATGWYRRKTQWVQAAIAFSVVALTNADTLMISEQLAKDPAAREAAAGAAAKFLEEYQEPSTATDAAAPREEIKRSVEQLNSTLAEAQIAIGWPDPVRRRLQNELNMVPDARAALVARRTKGNEDTAKLAGKTAAQTPTETTAEPSALEAARVAALAEAEKLDAQRKALAAELDAVETESKELEARALELAHRRTWWLPRKLIGLALTMLAVALGAPFWFQVLEKFAKVRSSGNRIAGADGATTPQPITGEPPPLTASVTVPAGSAAVATTRVVAVAPAAALAAERLDERYWTDVSERWTTAHQERKGLAQEKTQDADGEIAVFLARMSALAYEPAWTIRARLAKLGVDVANKEQFAFWDEKGTQVFAFRLGDDVVVAYRGTEPSKLEDLTADARFALEERPKQLVGRVHSGFADALDKVCDRVDQWIGDAKRIFFTGHSLGAALATLHFARRAKEGTIERYELVTFGSPRVGDAKFCEDLEKRTQFRAGKSRATRVLRFVNNRDLVTRVAPRSMKFDHVGAEIYIDGNGQVHTDTVGLTKWTDFTLLVLDGMAEFKAAAKQPIGDHSMDLYVRRLEGWTKWKL